MLFRTYPIIPLQLFANQANLWCSFGGMGRSNGGAPPDDYLVVFDKLEATILRMDGGGMICGEPNLDSQRMYPKSCRNRNSWHPHLVGLSHDDGRLLTRAPNDLTSHGWLKESPTGSEAFRDHWLDIVNPAFFWGQITSERLQ